MPARKSVFRHSRSSAVLTIACMRSASRPVMGTVGLVDGAVSLFRDSLNRAIQRHSLLEVTNIGRKAAKTGDEPQHDTQNPFLPL